jgi:2-oxoglutarate ferredoxin oxidoreductase subunit alpha
MPSFGSGYRYHITGLYHDPMGYPTQRLDEITPWIERVHRKINGHLEDILLYKEENLEEANTVIVAYGATARSARHAMKLARQHRHHVGMVTLYTIWPFPEEVIQRVGSRYAGNRNKRSVSSRCIPVSFAAVASRHGIAGGAGNTAT